MKYIKWYCPTELFIFYTCVTIVNALWTVNKYIAVVCTTHDDVISIFRGSWPFVRGTHRSPVDSLNNCQWSGALMFSSICAWTKRWANNRVASGLRRHRAHDEVPVMAKMEAWKTSPTYRPKAGKFGRTLVLLYNWTHSMQSFLQETVNYISNFDNLSTLCM